MLDKGTSFPGRERRRHRHAHLFGSPTDAIPRAPQQQPRPSHHGGRGEIGRIGAPWGGDGGLHVPLLTIPCAAGVRAVCRARWTAPFTSGQRPG